ncbi:type VI secretion system amidase effector protein Tae4 [Flectobacillus major]|uniref:type VI secretion system amidase effector protein Tae4 n=1 Tax=Flectobacillus major TaxID=103 RepID=UPI000401CA4B|nr:type VI secretion system amidase effector protein Tae4 [Flectobacillus major]
MNGGNFWENLAYSSVVVGLNHLMQHITRPRMIDMQKNYPVNPDGSEMSAKDVFKKVGGEVYEATGGEGNACATRVSYALNRSGVKIPKMSFTLKGKDGNNYIVNAAKLNGWLIKVFGNPDMSLTDPTFPMMGNGLNQGLYVMLPQSYDSFGASGHATLFLGGGCISNHCYFENAKTINLWRLK